MRYFSVHPPQKLFSEEKKMEKKADQYLMKLKIKIKQKHNILLNKGSTSAKVQTTKKKNNFFLNKSIGKHVCIFNVQLNKITLYYQR